MGAARCLLNWTPYEEVSSFLRAQQCPTVRLPAALQLAELSVQNVRAATPRWLEEGVIEVGWGLWLGNWPVDSPCWASCLILCSLLNKGGPACLLGVGRWIGRSRSYTLHPTLQLCFPSTRFLMHPHAHALEPWLQLRAGNVLGDVLEHEEPFDAIHVGAGTARCGALCTLGMLGTASGFTPCRLKSINNA